MYVPAALVLGVIAPVAATMVSPAGAEVNVPPVYAPVPVIETFCRVETEVQNGVPGYEIVAVGSGLIVTVVDTEFVHLSFANV